MHKFCYSFNKLYIVNQVISKFYKPLKCNWIGLTKKDNYKIAKALFHKVGQKLSQFTKVIFGQFTIKKRRKYLAKVLFVVHLVTWFIL